MIFGIGADIVAYERIEKLHKKYGATFAERVLSTVELPEWQDHPQPARLLMKRFAAKEALAKAAGSGLRHPLTLGSVSVAHDKLGKPVFVFDADLAEHFARLGVARHHLSISDEREHAVAFVVLECG
ncbi:MAG: holo-ACP synthase [Nitrosomonadales bacterium]|nr:holo-ACP synthase [Nitrosomonadales bacterium]